MAIAIIGLIILVADVIFVSHGANGRFSNNPHEGKLIALAGVLLIVGLTMLLVGGLSLLK